MSSRWKQVETLFEAALERPPGERAAWLEERCADDALRAEVEAMLAAHERTDGILDRPPSGGKRGEAPTMMGRRVGAYRLVREIGRGGMGTVYLAERDDGQFDQQVAIKFLRGNFDTGAAARRFQAERQILAGLAHPHIARLYDGGVIGGIHAYFVMEYVKGQPLDEYCNERRLSIEERLRLFVTVAEAVQHAHRNLVVHCDLKPANLLVTAEGRVKLLDFGIAKLLDASASDAPSAQPGRFPMTPAYASPEQVRGDPLTTASDVYQLGLVLYELLAGRRPYRLAGRSPSEVERVICETVPMRPSTAVTQPPPDDTGAAPASAVSRARATRPERLRRTLRGDLDPIVLKALRKEPSRRYASAAALVNDIKRYLDGQPVAARPGTLGYRAGKFVRRHRAGVAAAVLVLLSLVAGIAGTAWQARRAAEQARRATAERDKAEQVTDFLINVFEVANPSRTRGDTVTARELLEGGTTQVHRELAGQPEVQAAMLHALGRVYRQLGLYGRAAPLLQDALRTRRKQFKQPHADVAESLHELGVLRHEQGNYEEATALLQEAVAARRALLDTPHPALAASLHQFGLALSDRQQHGRAERLLREALAMRQTLHGNTHRHVGQSQFDLAMVLHDRGRYRDAHALLREATATYRALPHRSTPAHATALYTLAQFEEGTVAESLHQEALDMRRTLYGPRHPKVAESLLRLGLARADRDASAITEQRLRKAVAIQRSWNGGNARGLARSLVALGSFLARQGDFDAAESALREALALQRRLHGTAHPDAGRTLHALANLLRDRHAHDQAEPLYRKALAIYRKAHGKDSFMALRIQIDRAVLLRKRGDCAQATPIFREALRRYRTLFSGDHARLAGAAFELGACLTVLNRYGEAERHLLESYRMYERLASSEDHDHSVLEYLARLYEAWGKPDEAAAYRTRLAAATPPKANAP